ncbi:hypothetical protein LY76DRAFT_478704, partial [Colletotrichum caudatum]
MCELHHYSCAGCGTGWRTHKKLSSCESNDPASMCPDSLCMYVGNPKKPRRAECEACAQIRETLEEWGD